MREISAAELLEGQSRPEGGSPCIIDIRDEEEYRRGSLPGARNIPAGRFEEDYESCCEELKGYSPVWLLCHTGSGHSLFHQTQHSSCGKACQNTGQSADIYILQALSVPALY